MPNPLSSFWQAISAKFSASTPVYTNSPQNVGPFTNQYSNYPPLIGRMNPDARGGVGSGQTGMPDNRANGFWPNGYVSEGEYVPTGHGMAPIDNLNHRVNIPAFGGYATDGRTIYSSSYPQQRVARELAAQPQFTQGRSVSMWGVLEFPLGWRALVSPQLPARYNLYNSIILARPVLGQDALVGYAIPPGQAGSYPGSGFGRPLGA